MFFCITLYINTVEVDCCCGKEDTLSDGLEEDEEDRRSVAVGHDLKLDDMDKDTELDKGSKEQRKTSHYKENRSRSGQGGNDDLELCGKSRSASRRIIGEYVKEADKHKYPWHARVKAHKEGRLYRYCGGTLITKWDVLTACHCTAEFGKEFRPIVVQLGHWDRKTEGTHDYLDVDKVQYPEEASTFLTLQADYALLTLAEEVKLTQAVGPVCLPTSSDASQFVGEKAIVIGWGATETGKHKESNILREAEQTVMSTSECIDIWERETEKDPHALLPKFMLPSKKSKHHLCAKLEKTGFCQGDSGGGLHFKDGDSFVLIGIVSFNWNKKCPDSPDHKAPDIYANVAPMVDWIKDNMKGDLLPRN